MSKSTELERVELRLTRLRTCGTKSCVVYCWQTREQRLH